MIVEPANLETMGLSFDFGTSVCGRSAAIDWPKSPKNNNTHREHPPVRIFKSRIFKSSALLAATVYRLFAPLAGRSKSSEGKRSNDTDVTVQSSERPCMSPA